MILFNKPNLIQLSSILLTICLLCFHKVHASSEANTSQQKLNLIGQYHTNDSTWLKGELGRYDLSPNEFLGELQFSYEHEINPSLHFFSHIQAQKASESYSANPLGLVEFKLNYSKDLDWNQRITLSAGQFFLPISMENSQAFWESPYTIHFSSLNSWIGEEFRPIGIDSQYRYFLDNNQSIALAATVFGGNDSMGALLAYRGWSIGRQRTGLGDVLALPELKSLTEGEPFSGQRDDGTRPFGKDLDNRPGYALRTQFSSDQLLLSLAWIDNNGDRELHQGEYAWDTRFAVLGISWLIDEHWELLAEASKGSSTMGSEPGVDIDFYSAYFIASYLFEQKRLSIRVEQFGSNDKDFIDQENNDLGRAATIGFFWQPKQQADKLGFEIMYLKNKRNRTTVVGSQEDSESISVSLLGSIHF